MNSCDHVKVLFFSEVLSLNALLLGFTLSSIFLYEDSYLFFFKLLRFYLIFKIFQIFINFLYRR